ncbi:MAG: acyl-CoA dehydrogenase family protein [Gammaproteobacteria bacterium]|nr:acyl-CoA dehydrogenase family protein [Gammaproteobacteria bacterium]
MADQTYLDWPFLSDAHKDFAVRLRRWAETHVAPLGEPEHGDAAVDAHCRELVRLMGEAGWLKSSVPGENGHLDVRRLCLAREIFGYHSGLADFSFAMQGLGSGPISLFGSAEQKAHYLPRVATGEAIAGFAISERNAGSDVGAMTSTATRDGADYLLNGEKTWISNAGLAHQYVVFARTGDAGTKGISAFIVEADRPGLSVSERIAVSAPHPLGSLRFDNCRVPATQMLGMPGEGFKIAMATLDVFRSTVGAAALGFARRGLDEAVRQSRQRQIFGKQLADFQLTQAKIAEMALRVDAAALLIYRAAWTKDRNPTGRVTREASMAKLFATDEGQQVIDQALQLFGGRGVVSGNVVEGLYREIRALRIYEGTSEVQKLVIAANVFASTGD